MDTVFWVFVGLFVLTILSSLSILFAVIYFGLVAMKSGEDTFDNQNDEVTPLLGVVHPNKKG